MELTWKKEWTTPAVVGVASFASGLGLGFLISRKILDRRIEEGIRRIQVATMQDVSHTPEGISVGLKVIEDEKIGIKDGRVVTPTVQKWPEPVRDAMTDYRGGQFTGFHTVKDLPVGDHREQPEQEPDPNPEPEVRSVWDDDWDIAAEMENRSTDAPYVLHVNEYVKKDKGYHQQQLRWYSLDQTLVDENNVVVHRPERVVGALEFNGRGSGDPDVVYIRNDKRRGEYEVVRIEASFMQEVMGLEAEAAAEQDDLRHSESIRRFRPDRD